MQILMRESLIRSKTVIQELRHLSSYQINGPSQPKNFSPCKLYQIAVSTTLLKLYRCKNRSSRRPVAVFHVPHVIANKQNQYKILIQQIFGSLCHVDIKFICFTPTNVLNNGNNKMQKNQMLANYDIVFHFP